MRPSRASVSGLVLGRPLGFPLSPFFHIRAENSPPDLTTYGADEPAIIQLKDGRVWMLIRTQRGRFYESYSNDGAYWLPALPTKLFSSDSPAGLIRLKDGGILLFPMRAFATRTGMAREMCYTARFPKTRDARG